MVSTIFKQARWKAIDRFDFKDITYHRAIEQGTVRMAVRSAAGTACTWCAT